MRNRVWIPDEAGVRKTKTEYEVMVQRTLTIFLILLGLTVFGLPPINAETLPNGFKYRIQRRPESQLIAVDVWVRAGASSERRDEKGCAHFLEHTLFKGTTHRKSGETDFAIEQLGGIWQAATGPDYVHLYTTIVPAALDTALEILDDVLQNALLPTEEVEKERRVILDELGKYESELSNRLLAHLYREALPNHPYQDPPGGTTDTIQSLTRAQLAAFYKRNYTPERCTIVLVGNVIEANAANTIEKIFKSWKAESIQDEPVVPLPERVSALFVEAEAPLSDGAIAVGWSAPPAKNAKMAVCGRVVAEIIGSSVAGRLALPELSGTNANTQYTPRYQPSLLHISARLPATAPPSPEQVTQLEMAILRVVTSLSKQPVTMPELQLAKRQIAIRLRLDSETCLGLARLIGYAATVDGDSPEQFKKNLALLTTQDIYEYVQQYLRPHQRVVVRYLPKTVPNVESKP